MRSDPESGLTLFAHSGTSSYAFGIRVIPSQSSAFGKTPLGVSSLIRLLNDWHMRCARRARKETGDMERVGRVWDTFHGSLRAGDAKVLGMLAELDVYFMMRSAQRR